jgi:hypothetical protein
MVEQRLHTYRTNWTLRCLISDFRPKRETIRMQGFTVKRTAATPKAFANSSPGLEHRDNPGIGKQKVLSTLKGLIIARTPSGLKR